MEKRKGRKTQKSRNQEKVVGFSSASLFPTRKWESPVVKPFNREDRPPDAEENPGSRYHQRLGGQERAWTYSRYIHVKQEQQVRGPTNPPTIEPRHTYIQIPNIIIIIGVCMYVCYYIVLYCSLIKNSCDD